MALDASLMNHPLMHIRAQGHNVGDRDYGPDGVLYRWSGASWDREPSVNPSNGGTNPALPKSPFTTEWWTKARQDALKELEPYYVQKLKDANGDVEVAKKLIEQDYAIGNRFRKDDLALEQGNVDRAKKRLSEDYNRIYQQSTEDQASQLAQFGLESEQQTREAIGESNRRGTYLGEIPQGEITSRAPTSSFYEQYIGQPLQKQQALRKQAIERAISRQQEVAGIQKTRGIEDTDTSLNKYKLGQTREEDQAKTQRESALNQENINFRNEQDRLTQEKTERATYTIPEKKYAAEFAAWRAVNNLG